MGHVRDALLEKFENLPAKCRDFGDEVSGNLHNGGGVARTPSIEARDIENRPVFAKIIAAGQYFADFAARHPLDRP